MFPCEMKQNQIRIFLISLPVFYRIIIRNVKQERKALIFLSDSALTSSMADRCFSLFTQADVQAGRRRVWNKIFFFASQPVLPHAFPCLSSKHALN